VAAGVCAHLNKEDYIFSTHRSHGHCIAKGMDLKSLASELYGKATGCCRGKGGSMHLADPEWGIPGTTAIVGGSIPLAVGAALSAWLQGENRVSVAFFGDGAVDEGVFHESLNFASLKKLPVVFVCENNFYATNSPQSARQPEVAIADRAGCYDMPGRSADGNDVISVYKAAGDAIESARSGKGPMLLEFRTYRWKAHVGPVNDVESGCRPAVEYEEWIKKCPVEIFRRRILESRLLTEEELDAVNAETEKRVDEAFSFAKSSPFPDVSELLDHVC
jgi:TPP-dependent pyruvate/acetoin dehydrogenase alpha subunit